ncbi:protein indeterminate-domain 16 [Brachypodium distachyon]|uniref:Uncharacterized protein n=1 Tax=Brachypodium distachyon TaxID=15368 RepID=A0A2K2D315_BRADI|nr:protein indeterminate-domain 16 [Brachypodium distachyon]PNT68673.1 hypothetical protein BRADI_3g44020v3 [Brachypodium distachyon]|eukprot:XP_003572554.1 protein indeterminate-domain 16 [Brachypodium distachyon]
MIQPKTATPPVLTRSTPLFSAAMNRQQQSERLELQLILLPSTTPNDAAVFSPASPRPPPSPSDDHPPEELLDLSLSMSNGPPPPPSSVDQKKPPAAAAAAAAWGAMQALKRQTTEQSRLASAERAYAERVMEMARREVELAEREFARARAIWERARVEVEKMERIKEMAFAGRRIGLGSVAVEITCHACMQRFHP